MLEESRQSSLVVRITYCILWSGLARLQHKGGRLGAPFCYFLGHFKQRTKAWKGKVLLELQRLNWAERLYISRKLRPLLRPCTMRFKSIGIAQIRSWRNHALSFLWNNVMWIYYTDFRQKNKEHSSSSRWTWRGFILSVLGCSTKLWALKRKYEITYYSRSYFFCIS